MVWWSGVPGWNCGEGWTGTRRILPGAAGWTGTCVRQGRWEKRRGWLCRAGRRPLPCLRAGTSESPAPAQAARAPAVCWQVLEDGREPFGKPARTEGLSARPMLAGVNGNLGSF